MWVLRELVRLLERVSVAVAIAVALAEVLTLLSSGDRTHEFQVCLIVIGAVVAALGGMGAGSGYQRYADAHTAPARTA